jgi:hypothetical protein
MFELDEKAFKAWFELTANDKAIFTATRRQAWEQMEEMHNAGEAPSFELEGQYTKSGNTEIFSQ